jgi:enterochelin esterase-like enzyme
MQLQLDSPHVDGPRTLRLDHGRGPVCLFLDGAFYRDRIGLPAETEALGLRVATLTSGTPADRHRDFTCSDAYLRFLVDTVLPHLGDLAVVVGVSLSGLAVAHAALSRPDLFPRIVSQSPSAWWADEALAARVRSSGGGPVPAWFSVGDGERATDVRHPPTGMHQRTSQWDAVTRLADAWGDRATLRPFQGGHEAPGWRGELAEALTWVMRA